MKTIHRRVCQTHGTNLKVTDAKDGSDTKLAYCRSCGRYYGRVMNNPKLQLGGFRPARVAGGSDEHAT